MNDSMLREILRRRLSGTLPGESAQLRMAPDFRRPLSFYEKEIPSAKTAAVMLLLFRNHLDELSTLLIKRKESGVHGAQIALPGGRIEDTDPDLVAAALRETREEIAADPFHIEILGQLSPLYIPPSKFYVTPVVGWYSGPMNFTIAEKEISKIYITPVSRFLNDEHRFVSEFITHTGIPTRAPAYRLGEESMWGATAMIFAEFSELYKDLI